MKKCIGIKMTEKEELAKLTEKVDTLSKKVDALDKKMDKIDSNSKELIKNSEKLIAKMDHQQSVDIVKNSICDPTGMLSKEMTEYFYKSIKKYQTTKFRTWLATRSKPIVNESITQFVKSQIPQLNWYGAKVTRMGNNEFHYTAKSSFPFELDTGVPIVGKIALASIQCEVHGDIDSETRVVKNLKFKFDADQPHGNVLDDLEDDLTDSLKEHKRTYGLLSPFGRGLKKIKKLLINTPTFSVPLLLFTIATIVFPGIPPAPQIFSALGVFLFNFRILGINLMNVWHGLVNGVIVGTVVWFIFKYNVIDKLQRKKVCKSENESGLQEAETSVAETK